VGSHGDDDASWRQLLTRPPELSGNLTSRDIWKQVGEMDEEKECCVFSIFYTLKDFYMP
jgi:hypothetical protein